MQDSFKKLESCSRKRRDLEIEFRKRSREYHILKGKLEVAKEKKKNAALLKSKDDEIS